MIRIFVIPLLLISNFALASTVDCQEHRIDGVATSRDTISFSGMDCHAGLSHYSPLFVIRPTKDRIVMHVQFAPGAGDLAMNEGRRVTLLGDIKASIGREHNYYQISNARVVGIQGQ